jgi:hypothetical protein
VSELVSARGIAVETAVHAHQESVSEIVLTPGGRRIAVADVIALPAMAGPAIDGLPGDEGGFIPIDGHARIVGVDDVDAAGGEALALLEPVTTRVVHRNGDGLSGRRDGPEGRCLIIPAAPSRQRPPPSS